jgi:PAS domain S-box-containing protein
LSRTKSKDSIDSINAPFLILDREGRLLRANRAFYRATGLDPHSSEGLSAAEIFHPDKESESCQICSVQLSPSQVSAEEPSAGSDIQVVLHEIQSANGDQSETAQIVRSRNVDEDSTQSETSKHLAVLRTLGDSALDGMYAAALDGGLLWANDHAIEILSLDPPVEGRSYLQSVCTEDEARVRAAFEKAAAGESRRSEAGLIPGEGEPRRALITHSPIYVEGSVVGVLGLVRDITGEKQETEQAMRSDKLRALGQLAWGVAHNFNNSLTAVIGYTQLVLNKTTDPAIERHLKTVEKAALDAAQMVQRIQNFARQGKDDAAAPADLNQTIRDSLDLTRSRWRDDARAAGIAYDVIFRPQEGVIALCDQSAMREVFVSIIINAIEAMPAGGRLTITTLLDGNQIHINFADTGLGMTGETQQRIFEPFYTTKGAKGQGMGLAVTFGIIERHGGDIQVTSEPGHGSTFTIKLNRAPDPQEASLYPEPDANARSSSVLVVDDEAPIRVLLSDILRARGHKVMVAEDGLAGLRAVENVRFDMVITDLSMPGADGWTVIEETRRRWPETKLVILTGYGGFAELAVPGGDTSFVDALISKPFNIAEIDLTLNRLLARENYPS